jgi:hypothetical protein
MRCRQERAASVVELSAPGPFQAADGLQASAFKAERDSAYDLPAEYTTELLVLLRVLTRLGALEPHQADLLSLPSPPLLRLFPPTPAKLDKNLNDALKPFEPFEIFGQQGVADQTDRGFRQRRVLDPHFPCTLLDVPGSEDAAATVRRQ